MDIGCDSCGKLLRVPDDKLPDAPRFKIKCPHCASEILVDRAAGDEPATPPEPPAGGVEPDFFPPGAKAAFVFASDQAWRDAAERFFRENGFHLSGTGDAATATAKLRLNDYQILFLQGPDARSILAELNTWPGTRRQAVNVVLAGEKNLSRDSTAAFMASVNTILDSGAENAENALRAALDSFAEYYAPLTAARKKLGLA